MIAEQELLTKGNESDFSDDAFLNFQHVRAFLKVSAACAAFAFVDLHCQGENEMIEECSTDLPAVTAFVSRRHGIQGGSLGWLGMERLLRVESWQRR